jgi:hypothetical protein
MQLDGLKITYRKEGVAWTAIGNQLGTIPEFLQGNGIPSNILGKDGQYYRNVTTQVIYQKNAGVWNNIGSWPPIQVLDQVSQVLAQGGVGKDLGTAPNYITGGSLNSITASGEYYVSGVTETPVGVTAGFLKVWRIDANNVGQILQKTFGSSSTELHFRIRTAGVFVPWQTYALEGGNPTKTFKALAGTDGNDVATVSQLNTKVSGVIAPKALALFIVSAGGVVTIDRSVNVSSITKIAVGKYQVGFINPLLLSPIVELTTIDKTTQGGFGAGGITRKQATWFSSGLNSIVINLRAVTTDNNGMGVVLYTDDAYISLIVY